MPLIGQGGVGTPYIQLISHSSGAPVRMCRLALLLSLVSLIQVSTQIPPRLSACRTLHKAKDIGEEYTFENSISCGQSVIFPIEDGEILTIVDTRNCANYFRCRNNQCDHCPCPDGEHFDPITGQCEVTASACVCSTPTQEPTTSTARPTTPFVEITVVPVNPVTKVLDAGTGKRSGTGGDQPTGNPPHNVNQPVSTEVIIIAGIVSATVIVIVVIVMAVFCWQRRQTQQHNLNMSKQKVEHKLPSSCTLDGYAPGMTPSERHVYAEIDERMINGRKHWQHGGSMRAPPLPDHQPPPTSPSFTKCQHHHQQQHHSRSDSGVGSADTSFTTNYNPKRTFQPIHPATLTPSVRTSMSCALSYNNSSSGPGPRQTLPPAGVHHHCCAGAVDDDLYHTRGDSSVSSDSQYSHSSNPTSLDSHDIDMRTPLHNNGRQNYMSNQVYI